MCDYGKLQERFLLQPLQVVVRDGTSNLLFTDRTYGVKFADMFWAHSLCRTASRVSIVTEPTFIHWL